MVSPYKIIHFDIDHPVNITPTSDHGYYFVFWKQNIPLGDLWLDNGFQFDQHYLINKSREITSVALEKYHSGQLGKYKTSDLTVDESVDVSIVICTRNRSEDLRNCLEHLSNQQCRAKEIIVVDNAPSNDSTEQLVKNYPDVTYCREPRPGLDIARNTGAKKASCSIVAYLDDDVQPHPLWIYHVKESFNDPRVMAMTGLVIAAELDTESQQIFEKHWSFNRGYVDKYFDHDFFSAHQRTGPPVWEIGAGANMAFRKSIFEKVGYFDERLDVGAAGCNGDSEMWFRILSAGFIIHYNPRAVSFHKHRREIAQLKRQIFYYMRGFAAAAMIQQEQDKNVNYSRHLFYKLPKYYFKKTLRHFPAYRFRYRTIFKEMTGLLSGISFYYKHRHQKR